MSNTNNQNANTESTQSANSKTTTNDSSIGDFLSSVFNKDNVILILWFLAIYLVIYFGLGYFFNRGGGDPTNFQMNLSRTLDLLVLVIIFAILLSTYYSYNETQKENFIKDFSKNIGDFLFAPSSIFTVGFSLLLFYFVVFLFRIPMNRETKPIFVYVLETAIWILLVIILFVDFFKYILKADIQKLFSGLDFEKIPDKNADASAAPVPASRNEVFNIANNLYTYDDAQAVCASYGATLATYDQIEDTYNKGGEWCNYGWSDGQMIYFPTQKSTWQKLQTTSKHKNDCGRPGVNGGYIANPYVQFGVNCYGKKPAATDADRARLSTKTESVYPRSQNDVDLNNKIQYWKDHGADLLQINSYSNSKWSAF